jgi:hypothetical protein
MALKSINKNFKNKGKDVKYLNKDFAQFKHIILNNIMTLAMLHLEVCLLIWRLMLVMYYLII